jgi:transcriptional regulator with XRE-family HTH domain
MFTRRSILSRPTYWLTEIRMDLMRAVEDYMQAHKMNRRQLAAHLECSPGYVSQMLNGDTNVSLEKLCEVSLAVGKVPRVKFEDLEDVLARDEMAISHAYEPAGSISGSMFISAPKPGPRLNLVKESVR